MDSCFEGFILGFDQIEPRPSVDQFGEPLSFYASQCSVQLRTRLNSIRAIIRDDTVCGT